MTSISEKRVLLTGGSRGLGPVIAEALAKRGAHIALAARTEDCLREVAESLRKYGVQIMVFPVDLSQQVQRSELVPRVLKEFGGIDILVNNAGVETEGAYLDLEWQCIHETIEINLAAPMELTYRLLPHMLEKKQGHIVNIASVGAKEGINLAATYCGTKAGLAEWTRGMRLELAGSGVHFSTIFPAYTSEVGMFARFNIQPPAHIGFCTPAQVVRAVIRAIEKEKIELVVAPPLTRLHFVISEISPELGDGLLVKSGVVAFQKKKVQQLKK